MLKIGHRGACGYEPENTLKSFQKALSLGVDMIEFDVHKIKSGELVIIHDDYVDRTTNGRGLVADYDLESLRKLDAGRGEKIPTLDEALDLIIGKGRVNTEIKGVDVAEDLIKIIKQRNIFDQLIVSSFNYGQLLIIKNLEPRIPLAILSEEFRLAPCLELCQQLGAKDLNVNLAYVDKEYVDTIHRAGLRINVYTVNDPVDILRMKEYGVDGIFSNYPDRL
ncbi:glycerophosphodiester phosphodiesterase [Patescibacteria group bacterium]|nr:glycerophosphodiester phosphodiesterase [Patescibacteria group bacterium]